MSRTRWTLWPVALALLGLTGCAETDTSKLRYSCASHDDCAEQGFACTGVEMYGDVGDATCPDDTDYFVVRAGGHCFMPYCVADERQECGHGRSCQIGSLCVARNSSPTTGMVTPELACAPRVTALGNRACQALNDNCDLGGCVLVFDLLAEGAPLADAFRCVADLTLPRDP